ncbi:hypothetical protein [Aliiroseovarius crassostreae]|uniref:hypothetical protein n=1 Tax=Aliiroseovarius crassostreae TaxID=154981 RepID=UPI003C7E2802
MMFHKTVKAGLVTAALMTSTAPLFADTTMVKDIEVEIELDDLNNPSAAGQWANIEDDPKNAIAERLTDRFDDEGVSIIVDMDEVELANTLQSAVGVADSKMAARVKITSSYDHSKYEAYDLSVAFDDILVVLPEDFDLSTLTKDSELYYNGMIDVFADRIVENLDK